MTNTIATPEIVTLTDANINEFLKSATAPVLVDVHADWCGPCQLMNPIVRQLAEETRGRAIVAKLDADANPMSVMMLGVRGIPTIVVFGAGREVARQVGITSKKHLLGMIDKATVAASTN